MTHVLDKYPCFKQHLLKVRGEEAGVTPREYECLALLAHGKRMKEVSLLLDISARTIETHLISIKQKLSIYGLAEAIALYWQSRECYFK